MRVVIRRVSFHSPRTPDRNPACPILLLICLSLRIASSRITNTLWITTRICGFLTVILSLIVMSCSDQGQNRTGRRIHSCQRSNAVTNVKRNFIDGQLHEIHLWQAFAELFFRPLETHDACKGLRKDTEYRVQIAVSLLWKQRYSLKLTSCRE